MVFLLDSEMVMAGGDLSMNQATGEYLRKLHGDFQVKVHARTFWNAAASTTVGYALSHLVPELFTTQELKSGCMALTAGNDRQLLDPNKVAALIGLISLFFSRKHSSFDPFLPQPFVLPTP